MPTLAERFAKIFAGLARSGGRYVVPDGAKPDAHGKILGRPWTAHSPITVALWEAHLSGKKTTVTDEETDEPVTGALGLGVVPIREDGTCGFGAIDVDVYPLDLNVLLAKVRAMNLPLTVCRTKSGGAHLYLFVEPAAPARIVRERLSEWAVALGHPGVEIFPKQVLLSENSDGSWINIPYSGGDRSLRYALTDDGSSMTATEFADAAERRAIHPADLENFELPPDEADEWFEEGPPCLQTLARTGFGDWQNNGLFNVAVYLRLRHGEGWDDKLPEYNDALMDPPLTSREAATIAKSVRKKAYFYKCKDQPIVSVCNRELCLKRKYGIGRGSGNPGIDLGEMKKIMTDPVTWVLLVDAAEIEFATDDLVNQGRFRNRVIEKLSKWPMPVKPDEWHSMIDERMRRATVVPVPKDALREGQLAAHLSTFVIGRAPANKLDEILMGRAWTDPESNRAYFVSTDFFQYLGSRKFSVSERDLWRWLRALGVETHDAKIKGKQTAYWSVPAFSAQTEEHDIPRKKGEEM